MIHCPACFKLIGDGASRCSRCGWVVPPAAAKGEEEPHRSGHGVAASGVEGQARVHVALKWVQGILITLLLVVAATALTHKLVTENRAAQASWRVQSQLGGWLVARENVLNEALSELERLYAELLDPASWHQDPARVEAFRADWRRRLNRVKATYQLTGQARFGDMNVRAEEALHNLVLYLSSLERGLDGRQQDAQLELEKSIRRAFREARLVLEQGVTSTMPAGQTTSHWKRRAMEWPRD